MGPAATPVPPFAEAPAEDAPALDEVALDLPARDDGSGDAADAAPDTAEDTEDVDLSAWADDAPADDFDFASLPPPDVSDEAFPADDGEDGAALAGFDLIDDEASQDPPADPAPDDDTSEELPVFDPSRVINVNGVAVDPVTGVFSADYFLQPLDDGGMG